jgi:multidrug efflux pump subunit AcrB
MVMMLGDSAIVNWDCVWTLWLLGAYFTATSFIGMIALAGVMVRNSVLLIDFMDPLE